ncbi:unnamed protein product [Blepharisma stoltei]|uniref:Uncharacterized protein n=1 Tax=Blepharisma stoltei TaxID=1481888 RepID=A0AAU9IGE1_9CILI|nr:unnamed protein product [Blepharisma stoltei]
MLSQKANCWRPIHIQHARPQLRSAVLSCILDSSSIGKITVRYTKNETVPAPWVGKQIRGHFNSAEAGYSDLLWCIKYTNWIC